MITPLELLNLYLTDGKSKGNVTSELYQKFNRELTWDALLNEGYQQDLAPMLYYIITKTNTLSDKRYAPSSSPDALCAMPSAPSSSPDALCAMPHAPCDFSDDIRNRLKDLYHQYLVTNMIQFKELDTILNAFEKEGIDVIQLKGAWIAKNYYPDPALRPMGDLDLLVRKEDMKRAKECLIGQGYKFWEGPLYIDEDSWEKSHFHIPFIKSNAISSTVLELHQDIRGKLDFINSNIHEFWENALPIKDYTHVFTIPKEHILLHIFWHTYISLPKSNVRLIWLLDIAYILRKHTHEINWTFIQKKATEWGIQKQVYFCLFLITQLLHIDFNKNFMKKLMPSHYSINLFSFILQKNWKTVQIFKGPNPALGIALNLIALNTVREKIQYFFRYERKKLLTKRERIKRKYGVTSSIAFYFFYILEAISFFLRILKETCLTFWPTRNTIKNKREPFM